MVNYYKEQSFSWPPRTFFFRGVYRYIICLSKWNLEPNLSFTNVILKGILIEYMKNWSKTCDLSLKYFFKSVVAKNKTLMVKILLFGIYWIYILWNMIRIVNKKNLRCQIYRELIKKIMYWWERSIIKSCTHNWALIKICYVGQSVYNLRLQN